MIDEIVFRCDATWKETARFWWAISWRALIALFIAGQAFAFVVSPILWSWRSYPDNGFTFLYAGFITACTFCFPLVSLSAVVGWKIGAARLVLVEIDPRTMRATRPHRTKVNGDEAVQIWCALLWRCAVPQIIFEYAAWHYALHTRLIYAIFYLTALADYLCWMPALKNVMGMKLGAWRLAVEPEILVPSQEQKRQRRRTVAGAGSPDG